MLRVVVLNFWCPLFETTVINMIRDFSHIGEHATAFAENHAQISFVMFLFLHMDADVLANMASVVLSPV